MSSIDIDIDDSWDAPAAEEPDLRSTWDQEPTSGPNAVATVAFRIDGEHPAVVRHESTNAAFTEATGLAKRIDEDCVLLGTPGASVHAVSMMYRLPASIDLRPLLGRRLRLSLVDEPGPTFGQTLTIGTLDGRVWLVARYGGTDGVTHDLAGARVRVRLSPKEYGPLVVTALDLEHVLGPGSDAPMSIGNRRFVVEHLARDRGCVAYLIADQSLWH
jgi:hypothetical protein